MPIELKSIMLAILVLILVINYVLRSVIQIAFVGFKKLFCSNRIIVVCLCVHKFHRSLVLLLFCSIIDAKILFTCISVASEVAILENIRHQTVPN